MTLYSKLFNVAQEKQKARYQKYCDLQNDCIMLHRQKVGLKLKATHSLQESIICLFEVYNDHTLTYATLHMDDAGHMTSDTQALPLLPYTVHINKLGVAWR